MTCTKYLLFSWTTPRITMILMTCYLISCYLYADFVHHILQVSQFFWWPATTSMQIISMNSSRYSKYYYDMTHVSQLIRYKHIFWYNSLFSFQLKHAQEYRLLKVKFSSNLKNLVSLANRVLMLCMDSVPAECASIS
jgi:hypothetical protein